MNAGEIMTKEVRSLSPEDSATDALNLLFAMKISGLPVMGEDKKLCGMFTEKEVLAVLLPSYVKKVGSFVYQENPRSVIQRIPAFNAMKVKDVMRKDVVTAEETSSVFELARLMIIQKVRRVPVLNKNQEVVGIVSRTEVVKALFRQ